MCMKRLGTQSLEVSKNTKIIGIDLGINSSSGDRIANPKYEKQALRRFKEKFLFYMRR